MATNSTSNLDAFLGLYKSTKAPVLRSFLKSLYERSPQAYSDLVPGAIASSQAAPYTGKKRGRKPRPKDANTLQPDRPY